MLRKLLGAFAASLIFSAPALAATGAVTFSGTVTSTCALTVTNGSGTLVPSSNLLTLSSKNSGGAPGTVSVSTTGGVNLSIDPATASVQPAGDLAATVWAPTYSLTGLQTVPDTATTTPLTTSGTGTVTVHLTATKAGGAAFQNGTYGATVTVRCEP